MVNGALGLLGLLISPTCRFYCRQLWWLVAEGVEDEEEGEDDGDEGKVDGVAQAAFEA